MFYSLTWPSWHPPFGTYRFLPSNVRCEPQPKETSNRAWSLERGWYWHRGPWNELKSYTIISIAIQYQNTFGEAMAVGCSKVAHALLSPVSIGWWVFDDGLVGSLPAAHLPGSARLKGLQNPLLSLDDCCWRDRGEKISSNANRIKSWGRSLNLPSKCLIWLP